MKSLRIALSAGILLGISGLFAQEVPVSPVARPVTGPEAVGKAETGGKSSGDELPALPEPKPRVVLSEEDVIGTRSVALDERRITFQKVRLTLDLPPLPEPEAAQVKDGGLPFSLGEKKERRRRN